MYPDNNTFVAGENRMLRGIIIPRDFLSFLFSVKRENFL